MKHLALAKIDSRAAHVAVIGLGYVGLPLAVALAERGFPVTGIDVDTAKVEALRQRQSYIADIASERLACLPAHNGYRLAGEHDWQRAVVEADCVVVATHHSSYDWRWLADHPTVVVDSRHVLPA